jgi:hypothetical protein
MPVFAQREPDACRKPLALDDLSGLRTPAQPVPETFEEFFKNREVLQARSENAPQTQECLLPVVEIDQAERGDRVDRFGRRRQQTSFSERPAEQNRVVEKIAFN